MAEEKTQNETAEQASDSAGAPPKSGNDGGPYRNLNGKNPVASPEQMAALATSLAIAMTNDKSLREIETMLNFVQILKCSLSGILEQRAINLKKDIEIILP